MSTPWRASLALVLVATLFGCGQLNASWQDDTLAASTRADPAEAVEEELATDDVSPRWGYVGEYGPLTWGSASERWKLCDDGREQSPVDLSKSTRYEPGKFGFAVGAPAEQRIAMSYHPTAYTAVDTGQYLRFEFADAGSIVIDGDPYALEELRFHTPSEHSLGGTRYRAEYQLVHRNGRGGVAIVAVLVQGGPDHMALGPALAALPGVGEQRIGAVLLDPADLVPLNWTMVRYDGSLAEPPCTEKVRWHVMLNPLTMSSSQIETLAGRFPDSARPVQNLNGRPLVVEIDVLSGLAKADSDQELLPEAAPPTAATEPKKIS